MNTNGSIKKRTLDRGGLAMWGLALLAIALPQGDLTAQEGSVELTYARDVAPIIQENCQVCHQPGAIAPMSFMSYEEVRPWAPLIRDRVVAREMPPYHYDTEVGVQELQHDKRLSDQQIAVIAGWVEQGAELGDPADLPEPVEWPDWDEWRFAEDLGQPDVVISSTPYDVPAEGSDLWHRPYVPTGLTEDRCIRAVEVKPAGDARNVVHHANTTFQMPQEDGSFERVARVTEYAMGKLGEFVPDGVCRVAPEDSWVLWDVHFYPGGIGAAARGEALEDNVVEVGLWLHPPGYEDEVEYIQTLDNYGLQGPIDLEPHGTAMTQGFHSWDHPVRIDSFQPHGHLRLVAKSLEIFYPETGEREMVSMISNWNANWHLSHIYEEDVAPLVPVGAVMILTAWYDNTANNPNNPDPDQWVTRGSRTTDEMSHGWIAVTHLDEEGYQRILEERQRNREDDDSVALNNE